MFVTETMNPIIEQVGRDEGPGLAPNRQTAKSLRRYTPR